MTKPICNKDCFRCPFPDCINDRLEMEDYKALEEMDRKIFDTVRDSGKPNWYQRLSPEQRAEVLRQRKERYRQDPQMRQRMREKKRLWYEANKGRILAQQKAYKQARRKEHKQCPKYT